jgi:hypothetical protein
MAIDDQEDSLPRDPNMSPAYQSIAADARRRLAAGTLNDEWRTKHLPAIEYAIAQNRKRFYVQ